MCYFHLNDELEILTGHFFLLPLDGEWRYTQMLNGTIPSEIGNLRSLKELWLCKFFVCCFGIVRLLVEMNLTLLDHLDSDTYVNSQESSHTHTIDRYN